MGGVGYLDTSWGLINPGWFTWVKVLKDPKHTMTINDSVLNNQCVCSKVGRNLRGLKIHQAQMSCMQMVRVSHRSGTTPDKTQEKLGKHVVSKQ